MTEARDETVTRVAVVTGGANGIGFAYGQAFADAGYQVVLADVDPKVTVAAGQLRQVCAARHSGVVIDVADEADAANLLRHVEAHAGGRVHTLINNAALMLRVDEPFKPFDKISWDEWRRVFDVNVGGVFLITKALLPALKAAGSASVINIGSDAVWKGYDGQLAYFASKGSIQTITRCLARELGEHNIRVNCIAPGFTLSETIRENEVMQSVGGLVRNSCAIKRDQFPEDVANTALFLAGPGAECMTGQTLVVNCGSVMP